jgi:hypothetical protein
MIPLSTILSCEGQSLEIFVQYDPSINSVGEIKSLWIHSNGLKLECSDILMNLFSQIIDKKIDEADWRKIYLDTAKDYGMDNEEMNLVFPTPITLCNTRTAAIR